MRREINSGQISEEGAILLGWRGEKGKPVLPLPSAGNVKSQHSWLPVFGGLYFLRTGIAEFFKKSRFSLMPNLDPSSLGSSHPLCELEAQSQSTEGVQLQCMETHAFKKLFCTAPSLSDLLKVIYNMSVTAPWLNYLATALLYSHSAAASQNSPLLPSTPYLILLRDTSVLCSVNHNIPVVFYSLSVTGQFYYRSLNYPA